MDNHIKKATIICGFLVLCEFLFRKKFGIFRGRQENYK